MSDIKTLTDTPLESALARLIYAGEALGEALAHEQELEDDRAAIKADAIKRIMARDGLAATPAEKVVETDADYFAHREKQRASIVARFRADAEYWAAKARATQASLNALDVLTLEAENAKYSRMIDDLDAEIKDLVKKVVAHMRARDDLSHANADLVQANRDLAEQITALESRENVPAVEAIP